MLFSQKSAGFRRFTESQKNKKLHEKCELKPAKKPFILGAYKKNKKVYKMKINKEVIKKGINECIVLSDLERVWVSRIK